jgi:hypothetical protein
MKLILKIVDNYLHHLYVFASGEVASWLEQRNHNPWVGGSNPSLATIKNNNIELILL